MSDGACKTCLWAVTTVSQDRTMVRECRRNPPTVAPLATPHGIVQLTCFPRVNDDWHCGDYATKPAILSS